MSLTRRTFLQRTTAALVVGPTLASLAKSGGTPDPAAPGIRVSARLGSMGGKLDAAGECGLDGVELPVGKAADALEIGDPAVQAKYAAQCNSMGVVVSSLTMDLLNDQPVASEPRAVEWIGQSIDAARALGAGGILVPFFGKAELLVNRELKRKEADEIVARLKEVAPHAKSSGVVLGLENGLSAKQNLEMLARIGAGDEVRVWYDIGNSFNRGYDVPAEIRQLADRICYFHFKDNPGYLGEGRIKVEPVVEAVKAIRYKGWIVLETNCPSKDGPADCRRNAATVRKLFGLPAR